MNAIKRIALGYFCYPDEHHPYKALVEVSLSTHDGEYETTDHRTVNSVTRLSISGETKYLHGGRWHEDSWGQIDSTLHDMQPCTITGDPLPMPAQVARLLDVWEQWHLNDMHGECIHQDRGAHVSGAGHGWKDGDAWNQMMVEQTAKCPHGYRYGSKWLVKELPDDIVQWFNDLPSYPDDPARYCGIYEPVKENATA